MKRLQEKEQPCPVAQRVEFLITFHGGVRAAGKALEIQPANLSRMRKGGTHPSDEMLEKLNLKRLYVPA